MQASFSHFVLSRMSGLGTKAHYHKSCYKAYARQKPDYKRVDDSYCDQVYHDVRQHSYIKLFNYIRSEIIPNSETVLSRDLLCHPCKEIKELCADRVVDSRKKYTRRLQHASECCAPLEWQHGLTLRAVFLIEGSGDLNIFHIHTTCPKG